MTSVNIGRTTSLYTSLERTDDEQFREVRLLTGITYRIR